MSKYDFDVLIVGSGPAGSKAAQTLAASDKKVAVVDFLFGGTCALRGCTPKKAMEAVSSTYWEARALEGFGFRQMSSGINWKALMAHKEKFTNLVPAATKKSFRASGITVLEGRAEFEDPHTLKVMHNDEKKGTRKYSADKIIVATGARPTPLGFEGADHLITSEDFFELDQMPRRILFAGGGYIAFELAHIAAACGAAVTIISKEEAPLGAFDPELVQELVKATFHKGIDVRLGFEVERVSQEAGAFCVSTKRNGNGKEYTFETDLVVHAAGRKPMLDALNLDAIKVSLNQSGGFPVNAYLQHKKHKHLYAIGDVLGKMPFTEIGLYEASVVSHNILHPRSRRKVNYDGFPMVTFTYPKLAAVGNTEQQLKDKDIKYRVVEDSLYDHLTERSANNAFAKYRVFVSEKNQQLLGAHLIGIRADEVINLFAIAMQKKLSADKLTELLLAYPTSGNLFPYMLSDS
ncbi:MAG: NAD(P)/FAD-dependent oxidoreductase [Bacteroidota bacterium]